MKKLPFTLFIFFFIYSVHGQNSNDIIIGKIDSLNSKILNEQRKIWIHVPADNQSENFKKKKYPVVYLLDGDAHFYSVVGMVHQLSSINGNTIAPQMIVVGIPNTNRTRDLTPSQIKPKPTASDSILAANSGGGDKFVSFIEKELIPYIDSNYSTLPYRMFIGHSLGGLTVMHTLINKPELFNSYVAIDPSMWWDNEKLLKQIKKTTLNERYKDKTLFLGIANTLKEGLDTLSVQKDTTITTRHIRAGLKLKSLLHQNTQNHLIFKGKYYEKDNHGSIPLIAEYDALRFIFDFHQLKLESSDYSDPGSDILKKVENHYKKLSRNFGVEMKPDEEYVNNLGYRFLNTGHFKKAEEFFKLNIKSHPESSNVYDSMGDLYVATGNKEKAIDNYKKSISFNKNSSAIEKLKELENK